MSDATSALEGASFKGFADVSEQGLRGMITLRGDLGEKKLGAAVKKLTGFPVPETRQIHEKAATGVAWMSPDELLILLPYDKVPAAVASLEKSLKGTHFLAANVSDARAVFRISGAAAREVIAKLSPADLSPDTIQPGEIRRTRMAQVAVAFWMLDDQTIDLICFRSTAGYVFELLSGASAPGAEVEFF